VKTPADFIGNVIGQSEANTKAILSSAKGKVLVIDEAYMLHSSSRHSLGVDRFRTGVIDTIVAEVQGSPGDDRSVLLLGYEDKMVDFFAKANSGLSRRFQLSEAFRFADFNDSELREILQFKLKKRDLKASGSALTVAVELLGRARNGLNFGNGGDVENLISKAILNHRDRQSEISGAQQQASATIEFAPEYFDVDHERSSSAAIHLQDLFKDVIGCEDIISKIQGFQKTARGMRVQGLDPWGSIPMNFVFKGPSGMLSFFLSLFFSSPQIQ